MYEWLEQKLNLSLGLEKVIETYGYIKPIIAATALTFAYTAGFLARIDPAFVSLLETRIIGNITFQLFFHLSIAALVFYALTLLISLLSFSFIQELAKFHSRKRISRFPDDFRPEKLQSAYHRLFM